MIWINPDQRKLQRILWRENMDEPIKTFELSTVTYGTTSAPFLATRTLKQLALDEAGNFPLGSSVVMRDMYIDDVLTGAETLLEAKELKNQLINIFAKGGMVLHKWCGNNSELIEVSENYDFSDSSEIKVLGVYWNPKHDCFSFRVKIDLHELNTKRDVLSTIARINDPLGLLGPVVVKAKIFLQKLWMLKIDWTDLLPDTINREWRQFVESLQVVNDININRCIVVEQPEVIELHGFSDASQSAYGAVIYCKSIILDGKMLVHLIASKSRVAPTKQTTIPRLELCAAVLLAKLVHRVKQALKLNVINTFLWSDSMIVLSWIRKESYQLKTFVANRIATIQEMTSSEQWRYVATEDNPADFVSRGMDSLKLKTCELWWNGPKFLMSNQYPQRQIPVAVIKDPGELKNCSDFSNFFLILLLTLFVNNLLNLSNDYFKIIRVLSFICRFVYNCKSKESKRIGPLDLGELKKAEQLLLKLEQKEEFKVEMNGIQNSAMVPSNSRVKTLNPFIDSEGILRVGGRLRNSDINYNQKFPILLPSKHKLTYLIVEYFHKKFLHSGPQSLLYQIRQNFWILNGRNICRKVGHNCVICCKANPTCTDQIMADLPKDRVIKNYPFNVSAVHLDIVTDLTSNAFIATLKRFIFRRGKCAKLYSDNATNFVGANIELRKMFNLVCKPDEALASYMASEGIDWKFLPPRAPNFGGLWEAGVKSFKFYLKRVVVVSYRVLEMKVNKEKIRYTLQFFYDKGENASQAAEIVNGAYGADTVTANYVQFWFRGFRSGIFNVTVALHTDRPVVENVDKITEIIEVDRHVSARSITQELKIDHEIVLSHLRKVGFKKKLGVWVQH
ncbi:integrase catalytic domain-containing protein [Trichonephila clavipes]|nr:integrase catalytic domain-containing protein [Trichonephila clavipes]